MDRDQAIRASHVRCRNAGLADRQRGLVTGLDAESLIELEKKNQRLMEALPYMTLATETLQGCDSLLVLTDRRGWILKILGPVGVVRDRRRAGLVAGASLREEDAGTTAVAQWRHGRTLGGLGADGRGKTLS